MKIKKWIALAVFIGLQSQTFAAAPIPFLCGQTLEKLAQDYPAIKAVAEQGYGPRQIKVGETQKILQGDVARATYGVTYDFTKQAGEHLWRIFLERMSTKGKTLVLVAMGGAEHLGILFQIKRALQYGAFDAFNLAPANADDTKFIQLNQPNLDLSADAVKDVEIKFLYVNRWLMRKETCITSGTRISPEGLERTKQWLTQNEIFSSPYDKIIVLDTGFSGSVPQAVHQVAKSIGFKGKVEGLMLHHNLSGTDVEIFALNRDLAFRRMRPIPSKAELIGTVIYGHLSRTYFANSGEHGKVREWVQWRRIENNSRTVTWAHNIEDEVATAWVRDGDEWKSRVVRAYIRSTRAGPNKHDDATLDPFYKTSTGLLSLDLRDELNTEEIDLYRVGIQAMIDASLD